MSEELKQEEPPEKVKQYLLSVDPLSMAFLSRLMPGIRFVEVEGMAIQGNENHMFLVNPIAKAAPEVDVGDEPKAE